MSLLGSVVALAAATLWSLPLLSELLCLGKVLLGRKGRPVNEDPARAQRLLFVVPAHDEEGQIERCVRSILNMESGSASVQLAVIADNCTDATAPIAEGAGARVWIRTNRDLPGKPAAVQWLLDQWDLSAVDAVVIIDADTEVSPDYARVLTASGPLRERAVQTYYGLSNEDESWLSRLGGVLVRSRYEGQYPFRDRAGLNAPLTGNGMVLGTGVLARCGWADDALTENWELYARYTLAGERIDLVNRARLDSLEPGTMKDSSIRRRRWQAGKWGVLRKHGRDFLRSSASLHQRLEVFAELVIPGPVIHGGLGVLVGGTLLWLANAPGLVVAGIMFLLSPLPTVFWAARAIARHPERGRVLVSLLYLPVYLVWRAGILLGAMTTYRSGTWKRSPRESDNREM